MLPQQKEEGFQNKTVVDALNSMLSEAEEMYSQEGYFKCKDRFYELIELCVDVRPVCVTQQYLLTFST